MHSQLALTTREVFRPGIFFFYLENKNMASLKSFVLIVWKRLPFSESLCETSDIKLTGFLPFGEVP